MSKTSNKQKLETLQGWISYVANLGKRNSRNSKKRVEN